MIVCRAEVEDSDVLEQLSTEDLIDELELRAKQRPERDRLTGARIDVRHMLISMAEAGVPEDMLQSIGEWAKGPIADSGALKHWRVWAGMPA